MKERAPRAPSTEAEKLPPIDQEGNREMIQQLPAFKIELYRQRLELSRLMQNAEANAARIEELKADIEEFVFQIEGREEAFDAEEEEKRSPIERFAEHVPSQEEVQTVLERIIEGKGYEETRKREDEKGLYLWETKLLEPDSGGYTVEYSYMRAGRYPEGQASASAIHVAFYDRDGIPVGGQSVTKYLNGQWVDTP